MSKRSSNRLLGFGLIAGMLLLAGIIAVVLVNTRNKRGRTTLAEMEVLGYLPDDTNVIVALNMPEAEKAPEGREVLDRLGFGAGGRFDIERIVGLKREQIEQAVIGLHVDSNFVPRIRVVVRTRSDYNLEAVRDKLAARSAKKLGNREYHVVQPPAFRGLEFALWCPTPQTLVAVYPVEELEKVPAEPTDKVERFAAPIADLLRTRSERDTFFWLVAHVDDWKKTSLPLTLPVVLPVKSQDLKEFFQVRTLGLGFRVDTGTTTTRARPARITETTNPAARGIAADLVIASADTAEIPALVESLESWCDRQRLAVRDPNRTENRYSASIFGSSEEWEKALQSLAPRK